MGFASPAAPGQRISPALAHLAAPEAMETVKDSWEESCEHTSRSFPAACRPLPGATPSSAGVRLPPPRLEIYFSA